MGAHYNARRYDTARIEAELAGKTQYQGAPCKKKPAHVTEAGTTLRDTVKYRCVLCERDHEFQRTIRRRNRNNLKEETS